MKVEPTGVVMFGTCEVETEVCTAHEPAAITAVWASPGRRQVNVCSACLQWMVRNGEWEVPGAKVSPRADVAVLDATDNLILVVEVKNLARPRGALREWAEQIHHGLISHHGTPPARYFMVAMVPGPFFLWHGSNFDPAAPPDFELEMSGPIHRYLDEQSPDFREARLRAEDAVELWLKDLVQGQAASPDPLFEESELAKAIHGGRVVRELRI